MLGITTEEQAAWQSATQKDLTLSFDRNGTITTLDNSSIVAESMSLRQTVSDNADCIFGNLYSSEFRVRVFDDGTRYKGATLTATISVTLGSDGGYLVDSNGNRIVDSNGNYLISIQDATFTKQLGVFEVTSDKLTSDGIFRDLICYDSLSAVLAEDYSDWSNALTYPITIKNYRTAFFGQLGLTQETVTLPNDSVTINKNEMSTVSGATILSAVLGLNGCWGYIGMDNVFHYALPKTTADYTITDNSYVQGSFAFEEFQTAEYSGIIFTNNITTTVTETDPDTGETNTYEETSEQNVTVGDATGSVLTFQDNILLKDKTDAQLTSIGNTLLTALDGFSYTPSTIAFPAYMGLELGDVFQITTSKGTFSFPVLDRTLSGITALRDSFTAQGVEYSSENANSLQSFMAQYQANLTDVSNLLNKTSKIANNANTIAGNTNQYFWHTESTVYYPTTDTEVDFAKTYYELVASVYTAVTPSGNENPSNEGWYEAFSDTGAHITEVPKDDFISDPENSGGNLLARSNGVSVRDGLVDLATFGEQTIIGKDKIGGLFVNSNISGTIEEVNGGSFTTSPHTAVLLRTPSNSIRLYLYKGLDSETGVYAYFTYGTPATGTLTVGSESCTIAYNGYEQFVFTSDYSGSWGYVFRYLYVYTNMSMGNGSVATGEASVALGTGTLASSDEQLVIGKYNVEDTNGDYVFIAGQGETSATNRRKNIFTIDKSGNVDFSGSITSMGKVLWTGAWYMSDTQTINIATEPADEWKSLSKQNAGYVLVWSSYLNGEAKNYDWVYSFVPKWHATVSGTGGTGFPLAKASTNGNGTSWAVKYLYITDSVITGYSGNNSGNAATYVLRAVIGI